MFTKYFIFALLFIGVHSRYILLEEPLFIDEEVESPRVRRQAGGAVSANSDGSVSLSMKQPLAANEDRQLSAIGSVSSKSTAGGFMLENAKGQSVSVMKEHIPEYGDRLRLDGSTNLLKSGNHELNANAFVARTMPKPEFHTPDHNTFGGGLDYTYKDKIGAGISAARTNMFDQTDVSAFGRYNLMKTPSHSLDFTAGASRSFSPHFSSSWTPYTGLTYRF